MAGCCWCDRPASGSIRYAGVDHPACPAHGAESRERAALAAEFREWRAGIRKFAVGSPGRVWMLVSAWNWATRPSVPLADWEYRALARFARRCRAELRRLDGWRETDRGRLMVL